MKTGAISTGITTQALLRTARATGEALAAIDHLLQLGYEHERAVRACRPYEQPTRATRDKWAATAAEQRRQQEERERREQEERDVRSRGERFSRALHDFVDCQERTRRIAWAKAQREGIDYDDVVVTAKDYYDDD